MRTAPNVEPLTLSRPLSFELTQAYGARLAEAKRGAPTTPNGRLVSAGLNGCLFYGRGERTPPRVAHKLKERHVLIDRSPLLRGPHARGPHPPTPRSVRQLVDNSPRPQGGEPSRYTR